ncbi:MAG TPA: CrcB family protein [bacterium]|nr:CrcB family protein [bacterium]
MLSNLLLIGIGGFTGAIARYLVFLSTDHLYHKYNFPFGTLITNLAGCLLIGIALGLSIKMNIFTRHTTGHYVFVTGFLGAFTTFSTFSQDNLALILQKNYALFTTNILLNTFLGLALTMTGYFSVMKIIE